MEVEILTSQRKFVTKSLEQELKVLQKTDGHILYDITEETFLEEQIDLSQVFKSSYSISDFDISIIQALQNEKHETVTKYRFLSYAEQNFQNGHVPLFSDEQIPHPLLPKQDNISIQASLVLWQAIHKFVSGSQPYQEPSKRKTNRPIVHQVIQQLQPKQKQNTQNLKSTPEQTSRSQSLPSCRQQEELKQRKLSLQQLKTKIISVLGKKSRLKSSERQILMSESFMGSRRESTLNDDVFVTSSIEENIDISEKNIPDSDFDIVHFIIAHAVIRQEMRDEILCQLCCHVINNSSNKKTERAWLLHSLCCGCFLPSNELLNSYYAFLHDASTSRFSRYSGYVMKILSRTNCNTARYQPPNWSEYQAVLELRNTVLKIHLPDDRVLPVEADSATTSADLSESISKILGIRDCFGFAIYVKVDNKITSLGCGPDHVMDAITEFEQLIRVQGKSEQDATWKILFKKELFTPWHDSRYDHVSTELIYRQIRDSIKQDEYCVQAVAFTEDIIAKCMFVDGIICELLTVRNSLQDYLPGKLLKENKSQEKLSQNIFKILQNLQKQSKDSSIENIKADIVTKATELWPLHFSAMFEATIISGSRLPHTNVFIAVGKTGLFVLNACYDVILGLHYYDFIGVSHNGCPDPRRACIRFLLIDGAQFSFLCPNSETLGKLLQIFLDGLRRRSCWAVATLPFHLHDANGTLDARINQVTPGDLIQLLPVPENLHCTGWVYGKCERSASSGMFHRDYCHILPTITKPTVEFIKLLKTINPALLRNLPSRPSELVLSDQGQDPYGNESTA